jgi:hypothetical protein
LTINMLPRAETSLNGLRYLTFASSGSGAIMSKVPHRHLDPEASLLSLLSVVIILPRTVEADGTSMG